MNTVEQKIVKKNHRIATVLSIGFVLCFLSLAMTDPAYACDDPADFKYCGYTPFWYWFLSW